METNQIWEKIHAEREWGKYPNEELVRFIGRNFFNLTKKERKNIKILELGCGQGANQWFLAKEGFKTYGIDISTSAVKKAEKYLEENYKVKADLKQANMTNLPFNNNFFDLVIDIASVQHVSFSSHQKVFKEVYRVLKSNGLFWSFHIGKQSWGYGTGDSIDYETIKNISEGPLTGVGITCMLSYEDLTELLNKEGFSIINLEKQLRTYENQQKELIHWIIEAKRVN